MMNRLYIAVFAIAGSVLSVAPVFSQDVVSKKVGYADLNLSQPEGRIVLQNRVSAAINEVCGTLDTRDFVTFNAIERCRKTAVASTKAQIAAVVATSQMASRDEPVRIAGR